jgi:hypothetical protein
MYGELDAWLGKYLPLGLTVLEKETNCSIVLAGTTLPLS